MADAMGGEDSEHYTRFKAFCCQAYNWLRKSANLILNLLSLMGDAGNQPKFLYLCVYIYT